MFYARPRRSRRHRIGEQASCRICGQDIEWSGRKYGWTDRGGDQSCKPYLDRVEHEFVYPSSNHEPYEG